tara:strand:- start:327 stop:1154 length:828 start_codon:yes stop_codon:yes gene_type:complete
MDEKSSQKVATKFSCVDCDYHTSKIFNWNKHISTRKHKMVKNGKKKTEKVAEQSELHICSDCGKQYKFQSGLCRHRKTCKFIEKNKTLTDLEKEVDELKKKNQKLEGGATIINNYNNNLTIKVYLNENCGNAMSIDDFVKNLQITMHDLLETQKQGIVEGMSSLIIKNLNTLQLEDRPIHCSDVKNSKFFIKTEKEWENDNGTKVSNALDLVQAEKMKHVSEYMKGETFLKSENETDMIMDLVKILSKDSNPSKKNKIIKNIANSVVLDPSMNNI